MTSFVSLWSDQRGHQPLARVAFLMQERRRVMANNYARGGILPVDAIHIAPEKCETILPHNTFQFSNQIIAAIRKGMGAVFSQGGDEPLKRDLRRSASTRKKACRLRRLQED